MRVVGLLKRVALSRLRQTLPNRSVRIAHTVVDWVVEMTTPPDGSPVRGLLQTEPDGIQASPCADERSSQLSKIPHFSGGVDASSDFYSNYDRGQPCCNSRN